MRWKREEREERKERREEREEEKKTNYTLEIINFGKGLSIVLYCTGRYSEELEGVDRLPYGVVG